MRPDHLRALTDQEAETLRLRAQALHKFSATYRHNQESQRAMLGALRRVATTFSEGRYDERTFPWEVLVDDDLAGHVWSSVAERYARATAMKDATALRRMLDCCRRVGLLTYEEYQSARTFTTKRGGLQRPPAGHYLSESDVAAIIHEAETGTGCVNTRIRDVALLHVLASSGARGHEVNGVKVAHLYLEDLRMWLEQTKSGKQRNGWLHTSSIDAVRRWLDVRGTGPGPLFVPLSRTGRPLHDRAGLSTHQIRKIVAHRSAAAGYVGITPHDLRRFVVTNLLGRYDIALVAKIVGHANPATTAGYDKRPLLHQRDAVNTIQLPALGDLRP